MPFLILQVVVFLIQVQAFLAGVSHGWGLGTFLGLVVGLVLYCIPGIGGFLLACMTFYGAYAAWDWAWWQAFIIAAPGVALSIFALAGTAIVAALGTRRA